MPTIMVAIALATIVLPCTTVVSRRPELPPVPTAEQIIAAAGSEREAAAILSTAIMQDAVVRFRRQSEGAHLVSLLDVQWRDQWVPKEGVTNSKDEQRVAFLRLSKDEATRSYQKGGHVLLLRKIAVTDGVLTLEVVDAGPCSSSGLELTFVRAAGRWRPEGETKKIGDGTP